MEGQKPIGRQLVELGLINEDQLDVALQLQKKRKERLGELLLSLKFIAEIDILKVLAERFRIHYISSDKLATIKIPKPVIEMIPQEFAEAKLVFPLIYDSPRQSLSVLANTPNDPRLLKEVQLLAECREVIAYLAMKPAILAGIRKFYREDDQAFAGLEESGLGQGSLLAFGAGDSRRAAFSAEEVSRAGGLRLADEVAAASVMSDNLYVETLNILISLLEMSSGPFRGHSAAVARLAKKIAERLGLKPKEVYFVVIAAYFHNLGKKDNAHFTLLNIKSERDLKAAQKTYLSPVRLIETANFPRPVPEILSSLFERYDGKGFPKGLQGEDIPLGARILAVADAYEDLVHSPDFPDRPIHEIVKLLLNYQGSCFDRRVLRALVEVLQETQRETQAAVGENRYTVLLVDSSGSPAYGPLIARLKEAGFRAMLARDTDTAVTALKQTKVDLILADLNIQPLNSYQLCRAVKTSASIKDTLFVFLSQKEESSKVVQAAFDEGADDFFSRPTRAEVAVAKVKNLLARKRSTLSEMQAITSPARASVTGTLSEISLADILQLLSNGRKTGMLLLRRDDAEAQVFISDGKIINCFYRGREGEAAFYDLLEWESGDFSLETDVTMPNQTIFLPTENLMLEGFRRLDERRAGKG